MRTFEIDEDLVKLVWAKAKPEPFENLSFSDALRRVLVEPSISGVRPWPIPPFSEVLKGLPEKLRKRAPKTELRALVRLGRLQEGQVLTLVDYRRQPRQEFKAKISKNDLIYKGKAYSMSALAQQLLKRRGYSSESVRGPEHWANADGKLVSEIWQETLAAVRAA
jgi:hypothetical protein